MKIISSSEIDLFHAHPFNEGIPEKDIETLRKKAIFSEYEKGEFLFKEGEKATFLVLILKGSVKLSSYDYEGREQLVGIFSKGETIWEGFLLDQARFPFGAIALENTITARVEMEDFKVLLNSQETAMKVIALLSEKLHDANRRNLILSASNPKAKIARLFLYRLSKEKGNSFSMRLDDIAAHTSLRSETASRKIGELIKEGVIEKKGQSRFVVLDNARLTQIGEY